MTRTHVQLCVAALMTFGAVGDPAASDGGTDAGLIPGLLPGGPVLIPERLHYVCPPEKRPASVRQSNVSILGKVDEAATKKVLRRHQNELRYCYEQQLNRIPCLAGEITVSFVIGTSGAVDTAWISKSALDSAAMESCVLSRLQKWRFPQSGEGGTTVIGSWVFRPPDHE